MAEEALLKNICSIEMEPETKSTVTDNKGVSEAEGGDGETAFVAEGVPLLPPPSQVAASTSPWSTSLFACLGNCDEFFSSDLEVCILGSFAPCLLYASNVEWLYPTTENTFTNHLLAYTGLSCLSSCFSSCLSSCHCSSCLNSCLNCDIFIPQYRTDLRKKYNLMGSTECFAKSCGCSSCFGESSSHECMESVCDSATHCLCHKCALCQEGREIRRRMPHPSFIRSYMPMEAPTQQVMLP